MYACATDLRWLLLAKLLMDVFYDPFWAHGFNRIRHALEEFC